MDNETIRQTKGQLREAVRAFERNPSAVHYLWLEKAMRQYQQAVQDEDSTNRMLGQGMKKHLTAYEMGQEAFRKGVSCVPVLDKAFMKTLQQGPVGTNIKALEDWQRGWTRANLDAPLP